jgi:ankyrin repeat and BTB/POZ domain-containing protein 2
VGYGSFFFYVIHKEDLCPYRGDIIRLYLQVYGATQLLEYCQGFLLQNMVALLTYDDSVKRLLFGKRLPGHNVLGALLVTLQKRIETRKSQAKPR